MKNKIDLSDDPDALFLNPWVEEGLKLLAPPTFLWRDIPSGTISGFVVSAHPEINQRIRFVVNAARRHRMFDRAVEVNTVPVVVDRASFRKASLLANGKLVLSGASGTRLLNTYRWDHEAAEFDPEEKLAAYFKECQLTNAGTSLPLETAFLENDVHFAIECRNTFNFYHFVVESLSQINVLDAVGFQGNIYFHYPNLEEKRCSFAENLWRRCFRNTQAACFSNGRPRNTRWS